jgi:AIG2-like family
MPLLWPALINNWPDVLIRSRLSWIAIADLFASPSLAISSLYRKKPDMSTSPAQNTASNAKTQKPVAAFFYGSFVRPEIMALADFHPTSIQVAKLSGFDITFDPHANIFRSDQHSICGILVYPSHEQLHRLYSRDGVGVFLPEAVVVGTEDHRFLPAICYMPPTRGNKPPDLVYIQHLVDAAREHKFPDWYVKRLQSFL